MDELDLYEKLEKLKKFKESKIYEKNKDEIKDYIKFIETFARNLNSGLIEKNQHVNINQSEHKFKSVNFMLLYGGTAINKYMPKESKFYNYETTMKDLDYITHNGGEVCTLLIKAFKKEEKYKNKDISSVPALHPGTFKFYIDNIHIIDISTADKTQEYYLDDYNQQMKNKQNLTVPLEWLLSSFFTELSRPIGNISRWNKVLKRCSMLCREKNDFLKKNLEEEKNLEDLYNKTIKINKKNLQDLFTIIEGTNKKYDICFIDRNAVNIHNSLIDKLYANDHNLFEYNNTDISDKLEIYPIHILWSIKHNKNISLSEIHEKHNNEWDSLIPTLKNWVEKFSYIEIYTCTYINEIIDNFIGLRYKTEFGGKNIITIYKVNPLYCYSYINYKNFKIATIQTIITYYTNFYIVTKNNNILQKKRKNILEKLNNNSEQFIDKLKISQKEKHKRNKKIKDEKDKIYENNYSIIYPSNSNYVYSINILNELMKGLIPNFFTTLYELINLFFKFIFGKKNLDILYKNVIHRDNYNCIGQVSTITDLKYQRTTSYEEFGYQGTIKTKNTMNKSWLNKELIKTTNNLEGCIISNNYTDIVKKKTRVVVKSKKNIQIIEISKLKDFTFNFSNPYIENFKNIGLFVNTKINNIPTKWGFLKNEKIIWKEVEYTKYAKKLLKKYSNIWQIYLERNKELNYNTNLLLTGDWLKQEIKDTKRKGIIIGFMEKDIKVRFPDSYSQWVQCDKCNKERIVNLSSEKFKKLGMKDTKWYCKDNEDKRYASCDIPEYADIEKGNKNVLNFTTMYLPKDHIYKFNWEYFKANQSKCLTKKNLGKTFIKISKKKKIKDKINIKTRKIKAYKLKKNSKVK